MKPTLTRAPQAAGWAITIGPENEWTEERAPEGVDRGRRWCEVSALSPNCKVTRNYVLELQGRRLIAFGPSDPVAKAVADVIHAQLVTP